MKAKHLVIIILLLGAASVAAYFLKGAVLSSKDPMEGKLLFPDFPVNDIASFEIKTAENSVRLQFSNDQWVVADKFDYPADFSKITRLLRGLKDAVVIRTLKGSPDELSRLELKDPQSDAQTTEKGSRLILKDNKGTVIASILLGGERKTPNRSATGRFVRLQDNNKIYLITGQHMVYDGSPLGWVEHMIVDIRPENIRQISCYMNDTNEKIYSFQRPEKGEMFESVGPASNYTREDMFMVATGLYLVALDDVSPVDPELREHLDSPMVFEFVTYDDIVYRVYPAKASPDSPQGQYTLRLDAGCITTTGSEECVQRAAKLHERLTPWVFKVGVTYYNRYFPAPQQPAVTQQASPAPPQAGAGQ